MTVPLWSLLGGEQLSPLTSSKQRSHQAIVQNSNSFPLTSMIAG